MVRPATETRTPRARQTVTPSSASSSSDDDRWAWLTRVAFVLALGLVICRATVNEILREPFPVAPLKSGEVAPPRAPGPTTSLVLDLASCLPALLVLARRLIDKTYVLRWSWSIVPLIALAAWALLSTAWSADRFLAAIAACQLLAAGALLWATTQLVRSWLRLRVVAAVCFGLLLVYTANGILFRWIDVPQMREYWQKNRAEVLKSRGWDEGDFMARQFERKVTSGEMIGFNVSPNSLAATVVLLVVVSAGVMLQRFSDRDPPGWGLLMIPGIAAGFWLIYYTGSRTAFATPLLAAGAFAGLRILRGWLSRRAALAYWLGLGAVLVVMLALVGHGLYHGSLLHDSLTFRWKYWVGSWDVF
ncbi:MAG: hypothetical protein ACREIT_04520, partial [Tepidisphaeraceae bacterium]